jgi:hypothetical protein
MEFECLQSHDWDRYLIKSPYRTFFQKSFWIDSVCQFLGGKSQLLKHSLGEKSWLIPVYQGSPWSSGFRVGSVGYGGPLPLHHIVNPMSERDYMFQIIEKLEKFNQCVCTGCCAFPHHLWYEMNSFSGQYFTETEMIQLQNSHEAVFNDVITGNVRTAIRRANKNNVQVHLLKEEHLAEAGHLLRETQTTVGASYTTSQKLLEHLFKYKKEGVEFWGAFNEHNELIAMAVLLIDGQTAIHLFHGWKRKSLSHSDAGQGINQALIWEMIKSSINQKCVYFNLGESHSNPLKEAKQRWGSLTYPILRFQKR